MLVYLALGVGASESSGIRKRERDREVCSLAVRHCRLGLTVLGASMVAVGPTSTRSSQSHHSHTSFPCGRLNRRTVRPSKEDTMLVGSQFDGIPDP